MDSQGAKILKYLRTHKRGITTMDAFLKLGISRLSGRVFDLRQSGYDIETYMETGKNRDGVEVRYARYFLHE